MEKKMIEAKKLLVIGDVFLDIYYTGSVDRISPEAPVPVFRKKGEKPVLGGAANVAMNLAAAGQQVSLMGMIGSDHYGKILREKMQEAGIKDELICAEDWQTITKTRFLADNHQQLLRVDVETIREIDEAQSTLLLTRLKETISSFDIVILSDYTKGFLTCDFAQAIIQMGREAGKKILIDVKDPAIRKYRGAYLLKPNKKELALLTGMPVNTEKEIIRAAGYLREEADCTYVLVTCGAKGMILVGEKEKYNLDTVGKAVFDVTGAGDTTIAYLGACLANGMEIREAVEFANYAAGIQVGKVGTSPVYLQEVQEMISRPGDTFLRKKLRWRNIDQFREIYGDRKIVFTNGCFDILHIGHIRYLEQARELGDLLVVGVNSDESVRRLKGKDRPINSEQDRVELLTALDCVDFVIVFEDDTPYDLICRIQPDVLVKGGDYAPDQVVGRDVVERKGGKLVLLPFVTGKSTTDIISRIRE